MSSIDQLRSKYAKNSDVLMKIMAPNSTLAQSRDVSELTQLLSEAFAVLNSCGSPVFADPMDGSKRTPQNGGLKSHTKLTSTWSKFCFGHTFYEVLSPSFELLIYVYCGGTAMERC